MVYCKCCFQETHTLFLRHKFFKVAYRCSCVRKETMQGWILSLSYLVTLVTNHSCCFHKESKFVECAMRGQTKSKRVWGKIQVQRLFCLPLMLQKALSGVCPYVSGSQPHCLFWLCSERADRHVWTGAELLAETSGNYLLASSPAPEEPTHPPPTHTHIHTHPHTFPPLVSLKVSVRLEEACCYTITLPI